jgi:hypothetical protein
MCVVRRQKPMRPSATATGLFAVLAATAVVTFTAIAESRRRGHWCSSPRFVVTTYAAINTERAAAAMVDTFPIYENLWRRAQGDGIFVHYGHWLDESLSGYFHPHSEEPDRGPEIAIRRPYYIEPDDEPRRESSAPPHLPQPDIDDELLTLAHEYGHACSSAGRTEASEYKLYQLARKRCESVMEDEVKNLSTDLSLPEWNERLRRAVHERLDEDVRNRIIREEALAWEIGREVLDALGFPDLGPYDAHARRRLHIYRYRLGIEDLWPDDELDDMSTE